jgi:hypothetical protein
MLSEKERPIKGKIPLFFLLSSGTNEGSVGKLPSERKDILSVRFAIFDVHTDRSKLLVQ